MLALGCTGVETASTTSAIDDNHHHDHDRDATSLRFHSPTSRVEIRTTPPPPGHSNVSVYLVFDSIQGEASDHRPKGVVFSGTISGKIGTDPRLLDAALPAFAAASLGLVSEDAVTALTGLEIDPPISPPDNPPEDQVALDFTKLTMTYVAQDGDDTGALASAWLDQLGICTTCEVVK